uniref:Olfactory receptor n=1 Tax=Gouania willdenowi TaxID=441366 RepID=A0A8C5EPJ9_GOUWI
LLTKVIRSTLNLPSMFIYPAFIFGLFTFLITIFCNVLIIAVIAFSKDLQKPMFLLLVNLPIGDILALIAFFPQFLISIVTQNRSITYNACMSQAFFIHLYGCTNIFTLSICRNKIVDLYCNNPSIMKLICDNTNRLITYNACMSQAFFLHFYGGANIFTLSVMAYDRYIAICAPLRYNAIMTPQKVIQLIFWIWFFCLARFKICRSKIVDLYCNNPSIMKLICNNTAVNNYYGLFTLILSLGGSSLVVIYSYTQILFTCVKTNQADAWHKAIQTCGTHLVSFLLFQVFTMISFLAHRFQNAPASLRQILGLCILIFPPVLDPIIYGLKVQELRLNIVRFLKKTLGLTK